MINLLPPKRLLNLRIARANTILRRYIELALISLMLLAAALAVSYYFLHARQQNVQATLDINQEKLKKLEPVQAEAQQLSTTINTIAGLQSRNVRFSQMLTKIGGAMPNGAVLTGLQFSLENATAPFVISAEVENEELAAVLRNNLLAIGLFNSATIKKITLLDDTKVAPVDGAESSPQSDAAKTYRYTTTIDTYLNEVGVAQ